MTLQALLSLSALLFCIGTYGVIARRNAVGVLLGLELMANAVNLNLVAFAATGPAGAASHEFGTVAQVFALFAIALTVAEVVVGIAIVVLIYRSYRDVQLDLANEMSG